MSTRCEVLVKDYGDEITQYYHHTDGYPEFMGIFLRALLSAGYDKFSERHDTLKKALKTNKSFKIEKHGKVHHEDIEFLYLVDVKENKVWCYRRGFRELKDVVNIGKRVNHASRASEIKVIFSYRDKVIK